MTRSAGYALIETLVAAAIVVAVAAGVAHVAVLTGAAVQASGAQGRALFLAVQKIEQLQSLVWTFDADLQPVSDESTSLAVDPPAPGGRGPCRRPARSPDPRPTATWTIWTATAAGSARVLSRRPAPRSSAAGR